MAHLLKRLLRGWGIIAATAVALAVLSLGFSRSARIFAPSFVFYTILEIVLFVSRGFVGKVRPDAGGS